MNTGPTGRNTGRTDKVPVIGQPGNGPHERAENRFLPQSVIASFRFLWTIKVILALPKST
jgi:hypothetical protein